MRVLLISANTETINMPVLPLGLGCVATSVQRAGYPVRVLNLQDQTEPLAAVQEIIEEFPPEVIGISVRNIDDQNRERPMFFLDSVKEIVSICRKTTRAAIVLGGAGYSIFPQSALDYLEADLGIQGEGEAAFLELLYRLQNKIELSGIPGLYFLRQGTQNRPKRIGNLAAYPMPLPDTHIRIPAMLEEEEVWFPVQTRRGCPMNCNYCSTASIEGRTIRKYPPEKVVEMISRYVDAGFNRFFFVDNTFNFPPSYAETLCDRLISEDLKMIWRCILYPWKVDETLAAKMALAGCREVSFGFESGSMKILRNMNKRYGPDDVRKVSERLKAVGIHRMGFLLLGGPGETRETVLESLTFADSLALEVVKVTTGIRIYPHTSLARTAFEAGLIESGEDLLFPKFYMERAVVGWLEQTVDAWMEGRPNWIK